MKAGVDVDMVSNIYVDDLPKVVRDRGLDQETIDDAVRRVLRAKYRLGLFEDPYRYSDETREREGILRPEYREAARDVARKSLVLLRNERGVLPLKRNADTALGQCPEVKTVIVVRRTGGEIDWHDGRDVWYHEVCAAASPDWRMWLRASL